MSILTAVPGTPGVLCPLSVARRPSIYCAQCGTRSLVWFACSSVLTTWHLSFHSVQRTRTMIDHFAVRPFSTHERFCSKRGHFLTDEIQQDATYTAPCPLSQHSCTFKLPHSPLSSWWNLVHYLDRNTYPNDHVSHDQ
jgi:hypothetical protein